MTRHFSICAYSWTRWVSYEYENRWQNEIERRAKWRALHLWISDLEGERGSIAEKFFGARGGSGQFSRTTDPFEGLLGIPSRRDKSGTVDLVRRLLLTSSFLLYLNFNGLDIWVPATCILLSFDCSVLSHHLLLLNILHSSIALSKLAQRVLRGSKIIREGLSLARSVQ